MQAAEKLFVPGVTQFVWHQASVTTFTIAEQHSRAYFVLEYIYTPKSGTIAIISSSSDKVKVYNIPYIFIV